MTDILKFFKSIRAKRSLLNTLELERDQLRLSLLPSGIRYDATRVQTSPTDRMLETAAELSDLDQKISAQIVSLRKDIDLAHDVIQQISVPEYQQLLLLRYLVASKKNPRGVMSWEEVADQMGYSPAHIKGYLHGRAIAEARGIWRGIVNTH